MRNGFCNPEYFSSVEGDVPMKGDVIYYSQNSTVGSIVKMTDAIIVDKFVILYVGTSNGHIGNVSSIYSYHKIWQKTALYVVIVINLLSQSRLTDDTVMSANNHQIIEY
jgi:hypothetical protein